MGVVEEGLEVILSHLKTIVVVCSKIRDSPLGMVQPSLCFYRACAAESIMRRHMARVGGGWPGVRVLVRVIKSVGVGAGAGECGYG